MRPIQSTQHTINVDAYLADELSRDTKHELIDGHIYMMAGASANHERISVNVLTELTNHLKSSPCEPFGSDMKVKVGSIFFYPDAMVDGHFDESQPYYTESPSLIIEVLSKTTRRIDETTKRFAYITLPSVQEYVLIEQDFVDVEVIRRIDGWISRHYFLGDQVNFDAIRLTMSVADIYRRVNNEDMLEFLANT